MTHTWGIPGTTFLMLYGAAYAVALIWAVVRRRSVLAALGGNAGHTRVLQPDEAAYLTGGDRLAFDSALAYLHQQGAVEAADGQLTRTGSVPAQAPRLAHAIHSVIGTGRRVAHVRRDPAVERETTQIRDQLLRDGLIPQKGNRPLRGLATPMWLLVAVGVARLVAGVDAGKPIGFLIVALVVVGVTAVLLTLRGNRVVTRTAAGERALRGLRTEYAHLAPDHNPSFDTYGPLAAGMAVGIFGTTVLWGSSPAFAESAGIHHEALRAQNTEASSCGGTSSSCSGDSGCGGGGGCGGGCGG